MHVRPERPTDAPAVRAVNEAAFESSIEADIVEALRGNVEPLVSLVAESGGRILGHVLFSPVSLRGGSNVRLMALGPMAVLPTHQRQGIGSDLVRKGLDRCRQIGCDAVVVLGHPQFYPRFGFLPASSHGIGCEFDVPDGVFMLIELAPGSIEGVKGCVIYHEAFASA